MDASNRSGGYRQFHWRPHDVDTVMGVVRRWEADEARPNERGKLTAIQPMHS